jgi:tetratricopeptide (TPR) repeat protein/transcriptional regulator with XRE-family HTH domain
VRGTGKGDRPGRQVLEFGQLLRTLRRRALLSQERLARLSGLGTRTVRDLEGGRTERPHGDTVRLLADALQLRGEDRTRFESSAAGDEPPPLRSPPPLSQLPLDVPDFTGRSEQTAELIACLGAGRPAGATIVVISGRAGVGKTALAVHVAHRLRDRFPDGQLFLNLGGVGGRAVASGEALLHALRSLGVDGAAVPEHVDERAALYRAHLAGRRLLVLIDNAADEAQVRPLLPGAGRSAALVTSRAMLAGLEASRWLSLQGLEPERSVQLLTRVAAAGRVTVDAAEARAIADLCAHLPLAVRIAGARLATESHPGPGWLLERMVDQQRRLDELRAGDLAVRTSFNSSYQALAPDVRAIFGVLGLLNASDFPAWVPAALIDRPVPHAEGLLEGLIQANLLDGAGHDAAGRRRYRLHELLAVFARERLQEERSVTMRQIGLGHGLDAWLSLVDWAEARLPEGVQVDGRQTPAVSSAWLTADRVALVAPAPGGDEADMGDVGWAVAAALVAFSFELRSHWDDWVATRQAAAVAAERVGDRIEPAAGAGQLVVAFGDPSQWGSIAARLDTCAAVFHELGERRWRAAALLALGNLQRAQGRFDDAVDTLTRSASLFGEMAAHGWEAAALLSLGSLHSVRGCIDEAESRYRECLVIFRERGDRTWEAHALRGLGYAYQQHGRCEAAVHCLDRCLPVFHEIGDRLWEGHTRLTLAYAERGLGHLPASAAHARGARVIFKRLGDRRAEAMALRALAAAALGLGRSGQAEALLQRCLEVFRTLDDPIGAARALQDLGHVHRRRGRHEESAACFRACLPVFRDLGLGRWESETSRELG